MYSAYINYYKELIFNPVAEKQKYFVAQCYSKKWSVTLQIQTTECGVIQPSSLIKICASSSTSVKALLIVPAPSATSIAIFMIPWRIMVIVETLSPQWGALNTSRDNAVRPTPRPPKEDRWERSDNVPRSVIHSCSRKASLKCKTDRNKFWKLGNAPSANAVLARRSKLLLFQLYDGVKKLGFL